MFDFCKYKELYILIWIGNLREFECELASQPARLTASPKSAGISPPLVGAKRIYLVDHLSCLSCETSVRHLDWLRFFFLSNLQFYLVRDVFPKIAYFYSIIFFFFHFIYPKTLYNGSREMDTNKSFITRIINTKKIAGE